MKRALFFFLILLVFPVSGRALTLAEGLQIAVQDGRDVGIARSDEDVARSAIGLARSPWLPVVDLYGRETWLRYQPEAKTPFGPFPTSQDQFLTYGVKATQVLYDFGKTTANVAAARHGLTSRELETGRVRNQAALDFITAFLDLLEADKLLQVARDEVRRYEAHENDAQSRFRAGIATKNEVLQAGVTLADARQRALSAENLRSLRESRINSLLVRPLNDPVAPEEVSARPAAGLALDEAWLGAETGNFRLKEMAAVIAAKEEAVRSLRAEYLPTFYLAGGYEYSENRYLVHQDNWSAVAGVNVNLFSGGGSNSRIGMAQAELRSLRLSREKLLDAVRLEVKGAYLDVQSSAQKKEVAQAAVAQAEENLRLQRLRYQEGVGTATDVLDAVTLLTAAESNSWKALYGMQRAETALLNAAGRDLAGMYGK
jgi:outer membrane protein TolC